MVCLKVQVGHGGPPHILLGSTCLYACAAQGPLYLYPACLLQVKKCLRQSYTHGAYLLLGDPNSARLVHVGTWAHIIIC